MRRLANHIHDAFDSIRADEELKGSTRQFLLEQRGGSGMHSHRPGISKMLVTVCILLLFVVGAGGYSWMQAPVSYVSIDVNPSVELALNRLDRVVGITAFNADGAALVDGLSLKGKKYTDAVNLIVDGTVMRAYLSDDAELVFTVAAPGMRSGKLQAGIAQCHSSGGHNCYSVSADIGLVSVAHEYGFSLGKYHAYLQLSAYDSTITVEDCREMSMAEIHQCIREHNGYGGGQHRGENYTGHANEEYDASDTVDSEYDVLDGENSDNHTDDDRAGNSGSSSHHGGHGHHGSGHK